MDSCRPPEVSPPHPGIRVGVHARAAPQSLWGRGYDWDYRVDTTSATVGWRERLLGQFHSAYQPTEPALFKEMMAILKIDFQEFTFIDMGSGKGRVLLMAADYPFRRILGDRTASRFASRGAGELEPHTRAIRNNALRLRRCVAMPANLFSRRSRSCSICSTLCRNLRLIEVMANLDQSAETMSAGCVFALSQSVVGTRTGEVSGVQQNRRRTIIQCSLPTSVYEPACREAAM